MLLAALPSMSSQAAVEIAAFPILPLLHLISLGGWGKKRIDRISLYIVVAHL